MSSFIPLNALEDYSLFSAEEHTRELQIEEGLKIFQKALRAHRQGDLDAAFELYDSLFKIDIIHLDIEDNNLSPTVGRLKYLAYKNHGILLLEHLSQNLDELTTQEIRDQLQDILVQFADALLVDESDDSFLKLFGDLARIAGLKRLSRFALECIVTSPSRVFTFTETLLNQDFLNPEEIAVFQEVTAIAKQLQDEVFLESSLYELMSTQVENALPAKKPKYISWIDPKKFKNPPLKEFNESWRGSELVVEIGVPSWRGICKGLHDSLHRLTKRKKGAANGARDPYLQIGVEISSVYGKLVDEEELEPVESVDQVEPVEPAEPTEPTEPTEPAEPTQPTEPTESTETEPVEPAEPVETKPSEESTETAKRPAEPTSLPPSKRTRGRGADDPAEEVAPVDPGFFNNITAFVSTANLTFSFIDYNSLDKEELFYQDFKNVITKWGEQGAELFLKLSSAPESNLSVPVTQILDSAAQIDEGCNDPCSVLSIAPDKFLEEMSESCSLSDFRFKIVESLMGNSSLVNEIWPSELIASVQTILNHLEPQILRDVRQMFFDGQTHSNEQIRQQLYLAEAHYELIANEIIQDKQKRTDTSIKLTKSAIRDKEWRKKTLHQRLLAWESCAVTLLGMCKTRQLWVTELELRHTWVRLSLSQCDEAEIARMRNNYEEFRDQLQEKHPDLIIKFVNFPYIQTLSMESVNGQISKLKVASTFAKIFSPAEKEDIGARIDMLESILKGDEASDDLESVAAREFLQHASIDFKHKLWYLLLDAYNESGEKRVSVEGYIEMLTSLSCELETDGYRSMNSSQRQTILLRTLSTMNDTVGNLAKICRESPTLLKSVSKEKVHDLAQLCLTFLRLLQVFSQFNDRRNPEAATPFLWDKASEKFKTMTVKLWTFFYLLFRELINGLDSDLSQTTISTLNDILSIVHEDLGVRKCCSLANSIFVDLCLDEIVRMKWSESEADFLQNIRCRFGIQLANEHYHPTDHGATTRALKRSDGLAFLDFIMNMVYRKSSNVHNIRADLRAVLDQLSEAIGDPEKSVPSTSHNMAVLSRFTVTPITWNYIETSLRGESFLPFMVSSDPVLSASTGGFFCVQGLLALAKFRQGKKAVAPGRTEDLQAAIKFFYNDILCSPTRYESWFGMANAYEMLTEDDLMWSAEKLDVPVSIVNINQRKALLCGLNSVNLMLQQQGDEPSNPRLRAFFNAVMKESQWLFLAKLFYSATASPLNGASFKQADNKIFCGTRGLYMRQNLSLPRRKQCYEVVRACLTICINSTDTVPDWFPYYLRSKVYGKLKKATPYIIRDIQKSIAIAPDKINGDILFEPHYKLVAILYKAVKRGKLTAEEALEEMKKTQYYVESAESSTSHTFYKSCIETLRRMKALDKRKWHHRPSFLIAKIHKDVFDDIQSAKDEMLPFFNIKNQNKAPVHIWKPDFERAGKHFQYVFDYLMFFVVLVDKTDDTDAIITIGKKLRRFNNGMVNHFEAWEVTCQISNSLIKRVTKVPEKLPDTIIPSLQFDNFDRIALGFQDKTSKSPGGASYLLSLLYYAAEFRRLNNGFGSTGVVDDTVVCLYLKMLIEYAGTSLLGDKSRSSTPVILDGARFEFQGPSARTNNATPGAATGAASPAPTKKEDGKKEKTRVTRKDILLRATNLIKACSSKVGENIKLVTTSPTPSVSPKGENSDKANSETEKTEATTNGDVVMAEGDGPKEETNDVKSEPTKTTDVAVKAEVAETTNQPETSEPSQPLEQTNNVEQTDGEQTNNVEQTKPSEPETQEVKPESLSPNISSKKEPNPPEADEAQYAGKHEIITID